jgi:hypothetical protein
MADLPLRCACGTVTGVLRDATADTTMHVRCYCADCRAWAVHLDHPGALDANGGTQLCQASPATLTFTSGAERVACKRLTDRGLLRWYASCCNAPLGNTPPFAGLPFVGVVRTFIDVSDDDLEAAVGPVVGVNGASAVDDCASLDAHARAPLSLGWRSIRRIGSWWWRGDAVRGPFFVDGSPVATPSVLTPAELSAAQA